MTTANSLASSSSDRLAFRADINGLRAIAVVAVVLYHFHVPFAWGGFIGVDVFFVISGYLMTTIITKRQDAGVFNIKTFYADRFYRIVPALWVMCAIVLAFAAATVDPASLSDVAKSVASSILFLSNFEYVFKGGYFGGAAEENWLLHTWSLSVEWQFYLLYPIVLLWIARSGMEGRARVLALSVILGISLLACVLVTATRYDGILRGSFFMLPTRAWELLAGGLVALVPFDRLGKRFRRGLSTAGLALILLSIVSFTRGTVWPSLLTVLPVFGAALVIFANETDAAWARLPGVPKLGLWSYSIYLWHWPVVAAQNYFFEAAGWHWSVLGIALSVALGWASYRLIEQGGVRRIWFRVVSAPGRQLAAAVPIAALLATAFAVYVSRGLYDLKFPSREPEVVAAAGRISAAASDWKFPDACASYRVTPTGLRICRQGGGGSVEALVIGDSYAEGVAPRYAALPRGRSDPAVIFATRPGCAPLPGVELRGSLKGCSASTREALRMAETGSYRRVVIVASWLGAFAKKEGEPARGRVCFKEGWFCRSSGNETRFYADAADAFGRLREVIARLKAGGVEVVVTKTFPQDPQADPGRLFAILNRDRRLADVRVDAEAMRRSALYPNKLVETLGGARGALLLDPLEHLCVRECEFVSGGLPLFYDGTHVRAATAASPAYDFLDPYIMPTAPSASGGQREGRV